MDRMGLLIESDASSREYKTRNILTLEERVQVIRAYNLNPIYQRIAEQFNCSAKQIKNIIASKEVVLAYATTQSDDKTIEAQRRRQQKIVFLGKVIYEYIQRAVCQGVPINAEIVRQKALEVKESIAIENFYPTNTWLQNFKAHYKICEFDAALLLKSLKLQKPKRASLNCIDLIQYVSRHEKEQHKPHKPLQDENGNSTHSKTTTYSKSTVLPIAHPAEPDVMNVVQSVGDDEMHRMSTDDDTQGVRFVYSDDEDVKPDIRDIPDVKPEILSEYKSQSTSETLAKQLPPLPDISCCAQALQHLKVLEDFAMLSENYRAIGLISQLEEVLKNPAAYSDFETE